MEIKDQSALRALLSQVEIPKFYQVRQCFPKDGIQDVPACLREKLARVEIGRKIQPGMRVVLTAGSRQIAHMPEILRELAAYVRGQGGQPYIIPAMGSHGGATAEGQRRILESYGITEEFCGCPIYSTMETVQVGTTADGAPVRMDRFAHEADAIIVVGRIKGHTAFRGPYESGLVKMIAIGLGKREGADLLHQGGFREFGKRLPEYARVIWEHCNILFGVGLIENEFDETCRMEVIPGEEIFTQEPPLLQYAKSRMPRLLFPETDILMVHEIGKNISGNGMDPNVTGTFGTPYATGGIKKQTTVVLDISEASHGSFVGLGTADITTKRAFEKLDTDATYFNMMTTKVLGVGKIPMVMEDDRMAVQAAIKTLVDVNPKQVRMLYIKNTLSLQTILISEAQFQESVGQAGVELLEGPRPLRFAPDGSLLEFVG